MSTKRIFYIVVVAMLVGVLSLSAVNAQTNSDLQYGGSRGTTNGINSNSTSGTSGMNSTSSTNSTRSTSSTSSTGNTSTGSTSNTGSTTGSTTPGAPNTGLGGDAAMNIAVLLTTAALAVGGATYITRRYSVR